VGESSEYVGLATVPNSTLYSGKDSGVTVKAPSPNGSEMKDVHAAGVDCAHFHV
jgi:hypothetical protein